jgi:hypothetical protein
MSKYYLTVIGAKTSWDVVVEAEYFHTTTNGSTSSDYYAFYSNRELVACYPINRTIITKIERNNEQ